MHAAMLSDHDGRAVQGREKPSRLYHDDFHALLTILVHDVYRVPGTKLG